MKNIIYLSLFITLTLSSCNYQRNKLSIQSIKKDISINQLSDSSFFSDIRSLCFYKNNFFVSEYNRDNIFILNSNLELEKTIGNKGKGPGELLGASHLYLYKDSIFVINDGKRTIEVFGFENHLRTINIPQGLSLNSDIRFCLHRSSIILTNFNSTSSISSLSINSDSIIWFGNLKKFGTQKENRIKNKRHLHIMEDRVIAIPDCQSKIEIYNMSGELLLDYEFRNLDLVSKLVQFTEKQGKEINSYYQLFPDSYVYENQIFILTLSVGKNDKLQCNKIIQFEVINDSILPKRIFQLGNGWFGPFCVTGEGILAYNRTSAELILYDYE
jgi:hypothetical protein